MQKYSQCPIWIILSIAVLCAFADVRGDNRPGGSDVRHPVEADLIKYDGLIIDSVEIENRNIYDTNVKGYDNFIFRTANKLHVKTQKKVLARELLLKKGDKFSGELAEETARNLRNRYLIYDAWIEVTILSDSALLMRLITIDEWSFTGGFEIKRDGNEYLYQLGFEEQNLLGLNQLLSLDYFIQEKDDNYLESSFRDYRLFGKAFSLAASYRGNPKAKIELISIGRPFYSLGQKFSYGLKVGHASSRNETFSDSHLIGNSQSESDFWGSSVSYRFGERVKNIVNTFSHSYIYQTTRDKMVLGNTGADSSTALSSFPKDSLYHELELSIRIFKVGFTTFRKIDGFGYTEDFTLGHTAAVGYSRAFRPDFDDHEYDRFLFDYSFGHSFGNEIFYTSYIMANKFRGGKDFQKTTAWLSNYYHHGPEFLTIAFRAKYIRDWRRGENVPGLEGLVLGGGNGLRGYPAEFKTGDKVGIASLEGRFNPEIRLLSTVLGLAVFADAGRTWKPDENFTLKDVYFSGGVGLRVALDRSSKSRFFRFDLAYSEKNRWELSLSTGQYFSYADHRLFLTTR